MEIQAIEKFLRGRGLVHFNNFRLASKLIEESCYAYIRVGISGIVMLKDSSYSIPPNSIELDMEYQVSDLRVKTETIVYNGETYSKSEFEEAVAGLTKLPVFR